MENSNITRDHIAMEAMKVILEKTTENNVPIWHKIRRFFGLTYSSRVVLRPVENMAMICYEIADAMIEQRK